MVPLAINSRKLSDDNSPTFNHAFQKFSQGDEADRSPVKYCDHRFKGWQCARAERQLRQGEGCDDRHGSRVHPFGENLLLSDPFVREQKFRSI